MNEVKLSLSPVLNLLLLSLLWPTAITAVVVVVTSLSWCSSCCCCSHSHCGCHCLSHCPGHLASCCQCAFLQALLLRCGDWGCGLTVSFTISLLWWLGLGPWLCVPMSLPCCGCRSCCATVVARKCCVMRDAVIQILNNCKHPSPKLKMMASKCVQLAQGRQVCSCM